jgi:hypothetical protein
MTTHLDLVYDACLRGDLNALKYLLAYGRPVDDYYVHQAASRGYVHILDFLRTNKNNNLQGLLKYAYLNRQPAAVEYLLEQGCRFQSPTEQHASLPMLSDNDHHNAARDAACLALLKKYTR